MIQNLEETFLNHRQKVRQIILEYRDRFPEIWENYTLVLLLVLREWVFISPDAFEKAARGELPNLSTVHRVLTDVKKEFQTPEQHETSAVLEDDWRKMLGGLLKEAE